MVVFTGISHGASEFYPELKAASDAACLATDSLQKYHTELLKVKIAENPDNAGKYANLEKELRLGESLDADLCGAVMLTGLAREVFSKSNADEAFAFVGFEFEEDGKPILKDGKPVLEFAARCFDSPSTCSVTEMGRAARLKMDYEKFRERRLKGKTLQEYFVETTIQRRRHFEDRINQSPSRGVLSLLSGRNEEASAGAYELMKNQKFSKDIDKVLQDVAALQTKDKNPLGGRRGKADGGFNEGYAEGGSGGIGDGLAGLLGGGGGGIATKAKGSLRTPSESDIQMVSGDSRSKSEILKVVKQRTPGLRHIYNKFLKKKPGFAGRVTLKFTIAPGGEIISIVIASSTTGFGEFDVEIKSAVSRWRFGTVKSGNTTVSIPFTFSE